MSAQWTGVGRTPLSSRLFSGSMMLLSLLCMAAAPPAVPAPAWVTPFRIDGVGPLALNHDGSLLAFFGPPLGTLDVPVCIQVWDTRLKQRHLLKMNWPTLSDNGGMSLIGFLGKGKGVIGAAPRRLQFDPRGFCTDVTVTNLPIGEVRAKYSLTPGRGEFGVVSPDGKTVAVTCGLGTSFALHDVETGKELRVFRGDELPPPANEYTHEQKEAMQTNLTKTLAFSPDGKYVAVGTGGGWVSVWDIGQGVRLWRKQYKSYASDIRALAFSPDSKMLASANGSLAVWWVSDGQSWSEGKAHAELVLFLPNQKLLVVDSRFRHGFMVWDLATGKHLHEHWRLPGRARSESAPHQWALSADGSTLAIWSTSKRIELWNVKDLIPR